MSSVWALAAECRNMWNWTEASEGEVGCSVGWGGRGVLSMDEAGRPHAQNHCVSCREGQRGSSISHVESVAA